MKRVFFILSLALVLAACNRESVLKVGTYNIRYENPYDFDRGNGWDDRYPELCALLRYERPDIFGSQEVLVDQLQDMLAELPDYDYVGVGRDDGAEAGEFEGLEFTAFVTLGADESGILVNIAGKVKLLSLVIAQAADKVHRIEVCCTFHHLDGRRV